MRATLYFMLSFITHDAKNKFIAKKCNQNISKKLSTENTEIALSKLMYKLKTFNKDSSKKYDW